jgi:flagellar motility protein MotE (MotC chaperone)
MGHAPNPDPVFRVAGLCFVGVFVLGHSSAAAEEGWMPVVVKSSKEAGPQLGPPVEPLPYTMRAPNWRSASPAVGSMRPGVPYAAPRAPSGPRAAVSHAFVPPAAAPPARRARTAVASQVPAAPLPAIESTGALPDSADPSLAVAAAGDAPTGEGKAPPPQLPSSDLAQRYCVSIADRAVEARIAWQKAKLAEAEKEIDKRIAALEVKTQEYRIWLARREKFSRKVTKKLAEIYAKMEPEAAAAQLVSMDEEAAASILAKLDPRNSSAILDEMQPQKAARLAATLVGAARMQQIKRPVAPDPAAGPQDGAPEQGGPPGQPNGNGGGL